MIQSPRAWYQLWCTICTSFGLQKLVTDGDVHIKYVNNKKTTQQQTKINLNNLAKHLNNLPLHDRIYPDCPHDTVIIIVVTYVDDNLVFTNCQTIRQQFAAHCNKRVLASTTKGPLAGISAHNTNAIEPQEPSAPPKNCTSTSSWHAGTFQNAIRPRYLAQAS